MRKANSDSLPRLYLTPSTNNVRIAPISAALRLIGLSRDIHIRPVISSMDAAETDFETELCGSTSSCFLVMVLWVRLGERAKPSQTPLHE